MPRATLLVRPWGRLTVTYLLPRGSVGVGRGPGQHRGLAVCRAGGRVPALDAHGTPAPARARATAPRQTLHMSVSVVASIDRTTMPQPSACAVTTSVAPPQ